MTTKDTNKGMGELTRQQFAMLCNPVKHYLTDKIGMDELNAGLMSANIVNAQKEVLLKIFAPKGNQDE